MAETRIARVRSNEIERAARVAVSSALRILEGERFVVFSDGASARIGYALATEADRAGADVLVVDLDMLGLRPLKALPDWVMSELCRAEVSAFVARAPHQELDLRQQLLHAVGRCFVRHAHMPGVSQLAFTRGLRIDYARVADFGRRMLDKLAGARRIEVVSIAGSHLSIELDEGARWFPQLGVLEPGRWGNLPAGALYASPTDVEGELVVNASLGEYFGAREGSLLEKPVTLGLAGGRVISVNAPSSALLAEELRRTLAFAENSDRIGLIAVGVNYGIGEPTGEALVDQNIPGLHLGIGDPAAHATGATWTARTSFAACQTGSTVMADGAIVIHKGRVLTPA